jgi:hypothetical protein
VSKTDHKTVKHLEGNIEQTIAEIFVRMDLKRLPSRPSWRTTHLMAKAAVAVYKTMVVL